MPNAAVEPKRYTCTEADPYDPKRHGDVRVYHPHAVWQRESASGECDYFRCPLCGTSWKECYGA